MGKGIMAEAMDREIAPQGDTPTIDRHQARDHPPPPLPDPGGGDRPHHPRTKTNQGYGAGDIG